MAGVDEEGAAPFDGLNDDDLMDDAEVDTMVREAITATVGENQFVHSKIDAWSNNIVEGCLKKLAALNKPFKYVLTCNLTQKAGAGLHAASCTRWNDKTDGKLTVQWENPTMIILVTVYWCVGCLGGGGQRSVCAQRGGPLDSRGALSSACHVMCSPPAGSPSELDGSRGRRGRLAARGRAARADRSGSWLWGRGARAMRHGRQVRLQGAMHRHA